MKQSVAMKMQLSVTSLIGNCFFDAEGKRPLTEGLLADDHGPLKVQEAPSHDLGDADTAAIDTQD